jgi:hypothetical protein
MQGSPHPNCAHDDQQTSNYKVSNMNPAQVAIAQQAEAMTGEVEPWAGEGLGQARDEVDGAGNNAAGQQRSRQLRGCLEGRTRNPNPGFRLCVLHDFLLLKLVSETIVSDI